MGLAIASLLVLEVAGCGILGTRRFTVQIGADEASRSTLTVVDETGRIANVTSGAPLVRDPVSEPAVVPNFEDPRQLGIVWTGGQCSPRPVLTVRRGNAAAQLSIMLDDGPTEPAICDDIGVFFGVTLHFTDLAPMPDAVSISRIN